MFKLIKITNCNLLLAGGDFPYTEECVGFLALDFT